MNNSINFFDEYMKSQSAEVVNDLHNYFEKFDAHCMLKKSEKEKLRGDFEKAFLYYLDNGISHKQALELLSIKYLGDFYENANERWFPLDDAAKIYPLSMNRGRMSMGRMSVYLKENVIPELLQVSLNFTVKRFPSFATTLKKGFFWHYLDMTQRRFCIEPETDIPCQPIKISGSNSQSFRIFYYKNRISFECFHALSDGLGAINFLKVLTAEYLRLTGKDIILDETVPNINSTPLEEEFENAFKKINLPKTAVPAVNKPAVQMAGKLASVKPCRIIHFKINAEELKNISKKYHTTTTRYLLALVFIAGKSAAAKPSGNVNIQVPVNLRKFYASKTFLNFVLPCGICLPMEEIRDVQSIIEKINVQMKLKTSKNAMYETLSATEKLVDAVKYVPLMLKQPAAKIGYRFIGDRAFTSILTDLGVIRMPASAAEHIESMDAIIGTAVTHRARCAVITFNNVTTMSITKATENSVFEEKIYELLCSDSIIPTVEGSENYGY